MKPRTEKVIHEIFGAEKEIFLRLPHKSKFFRDTENHPDLDEYGVYHYVDVTRFAEQCNSEQVSPSEESSRAVLSGVESLTRSSANTVNAPHDAPQGKIEKQTSQFQNSQNTDNTPSSENVDNSVSIPSRVEIVDLNLEEAFSTKKTFSVRQYENMDLMDSFVKSEVFQFAEQFSFLKVFGLLDLSTGETFIFQDDEDFYKVKSIPMTMLRDGGNYELIVCDKRFVQQQDTPPEIRKGFREEFDKIFFCDFDFNKIRDFMKMVRLKRELKGTDMAFIESMKRSENSEEEKRSNLVSGVEGIFSQIEYETSLSSTGRASTPFSTPNPVSSLEGSSNDHLRDKKLLQKNMHDYYKLSPLTYEELQNEGGKRESKVVHSVRKIPKFYVIGVEQVERYYSQFLYTELVAMRDLIESKMERNPSIDTQLELQFELQVEEAIRKRNKYIALFMEMDVNYSGFVTWEEFSNAKTEHYIQNHTRKVQEKYFRL